MARDGTILLVEPMAGETVEGYFNPVGQFYSGASAMRCPQNALATGKEALGTVATDAARQEVCREGGFHRFRRVTTTPFNRIFEVRISCSARTDEDIPPGDSLALIQTPDAIEVMEYQWRDVALRGRGT